MRLTKAALTAINTPDTRRKLMEAFGCVEATVNRWISKNHVKLTTAAALQVIREETGLADEDILESEKVEAQK